jgi:arsenate reductase
MIQIVHNTRCGKSRNCLAFIENTNIEFEIINYLSTTLSTEELKEIIRKLNIEPLDLVRQKEKIWIDNYKGKNMTEEQIIEAMVDNPIIIERPIVIKGDKAIIARELDKLSSFI